MSPKKAAKKSASHPVNVEHKSTGKGESERVLVVEAHADDLLFFMGGTAAKMVQLGKQVRVVTATTGDQSSLDMTLSETDLVHRQETEHAACMKTLGTTDYKTYSFTNHFLSAADTALRLRETLAREIRTFQPTTVCCFDPFSLYDENPDHPLVGRMAWEAAAFSAYPNFHADMIRKEGLKPAYVRRVLMFTPREPNFFVDVQGDPIEKKVAAGSAYTTQLRLMFDEIKYRLGPYASKVGVPLPDGESGTFKEVSARMWNVTCYEWAKDMAELANSYYAQHPREAPRAPLELAEGFHVVFLGILERLRNLMPPDLLRL